MKASWNTESPNWEKNCAIQRRRMPGPDARRGPSPSGSGPLVLTTGFVRESSLRRGDRGPELRRVVLEVPHEGRLHAELTQERVELAAVVQVLVVDDLDQDEAGE